MIRNAFLIGDVRGARLSQCQDGQEGAPDSGRMRVDALLIARFAAT